MQKGPARRLAPSRYVGVNGCRGPLKPTRRGFECRHLHPLKLAPRVAETTCGAYPRAFRPKAGLLRPTAILTHCPKKGKGHCDLP